MRLRAYVLAGGRSRRMGQDKARLPLRGLPMAAAIAEVLANEDRPVALVRRGPPDGLPWLDRSAQPLLVLRESVDGAPHPLAGLVFALEDAANHGVDGVLLAPCDLPGLDRSHVAALVERAGVAQGPDGRCHPLLGVVPLSYRDAVEACWRRGAPAGDAVAGLPAVRLPAEALHNVNRPEDRTRRPLQELLRVVPHGIDAARVIEAECVRQRRWGIVDVWPPSVSCPSCNGVEER